jgi:hypothetical protein
MSEMTAPNRLMERCDVREATHVSRDGQERVKIASKWGVRPNGTLAPPSQGGFGVVLENGDRVSMWQVHSYWRDDARMKSAPVRPARVRRLVPPGTGEWVDVKIILESSNGKSLMVIAPEGLSTGNGIALLEGEMVLTLLHVERGTGFVDILSGSRWELERLQ